MPRAQALRNYRLWREHGGETFLAIARIWLSVHRYESTTRSN